jgi:hypothetical protein
MRWYVVQPKLFESEHEYVLYTFLATRMVIIILEHAERPKDVIGFSFYLEPEENEQVWPAELTEHEFARALDRISEKHPHYADQIRRKRPPNHPAKLILSRTGPACPRIVPICQSYVVHESLRKELNDLHDITFLDAALDEAVRLDWNLGEPIPVPFADSDPGKFVKHGERDRDLAKQMGKFYELILPKRPWFAPDTKLRTPIVRAAFELTSADEANGGIKSSFHEIAFSSEDTPPWVRLVPSDGMELPSYHFVREDVCDILRGPGKWTLEFKDVEQF